MVRAIRLVQLLEGRRVRPTIPDIARELGVSYRNAIRWINAAQEAHLPIPPTVLDIDR